jgi:hypothetical protein
MSDIAKIFNKELNEEFYILVHTPFGNILHKGKFTEDKFLYGMPLLDTNKSIQYNWNENENKLYELIVGNELKIIEVIDTSDIKMKISLDEIKNKEV